MFKIFEDMSYKKSGMLGISFTSGSLGFDGIADLVSFKGGANILNIYLDSLILEYITRFCASISAVIGLFLVIFSLWKAIDERVQIIKSRMEKRRRAKRLATYKKLRRAAEKMAEELNKKSKGSPL